MVEIAVSLFSSLEEIGWLVLVILICAAAVAGYIDTLVGGGGLITIPALLAVGVPPIQALGTNKLQASMGTGTASLTLLFKREISFADVRWPMLAAFIGALLGAGLVQYVDAATLELLIPAVILLIVMYFLFSPKQNLDGGPAKVSATTHRCTVVPAVGFYDGMFGPATGSFFALAGVGLRGQGIVRASMVAKTLNFATNLASLLVFIWFGQVAVLIGFCMMIGQFVGASLGARALMRIDPTKLRSLVVIICLVMLVVWFVKRL